MKRYSFLFIFLIVLSGIVAAQATIRGKVVNGSNGEPLLGATVRLMQGEAVKGGAFTDIEGAYTIKAQPGSYNLIISFVSFIKDTLTVEAKAGEVVFNETLLLEENAVREDLAVEITAKRSSASEVTLFNVKRTSINSLDGVTLDQVRRTGDANVAAAMQRVVGVTVEGGKYIYVRGLGDRYSKTLLNGAELPGLDPNRNSVQMDLFPSNLVDNILVYKNFTPNLPGSFTGGLIDVRTKDFPDRFTLRASASTSFNTQASLIDNFLADERYQGDALGLGNDIRDMPDYIANELGGRLPNLRSFTLASEVKGKGPALEQASRSFQTDIDPVRQQSGLNQRYELSLGNQHLLAGRPIGYIASISYRRNFSYFENGQQGLYRLLGAGGTSTQLEAENNFVGDRGEDEVLLGGLVKVSYKPFNNHKFSINYMRNQSGTSYGEEFEGLLNNSGYTGRFQTRTTGYIERSIDILQAQGEHVFGPLKADWIVSSSNSRQYEPDLRFFANTYEPTGSDTVYQINPSNHDAPLRFYRDLSEENLDAKLNFSFDLPGFRSGDKKTTVRFGGAYTQKARDFRETRFEIEQGRQHTRYDGDLAAYLAEENFLRVPLDESGNLIIPQLYQGLYYQDRTLTTNIFSADQEIYAGYAMAEVPVGNRLKVVVGARLEVTDMLVNPEDTTLFDQIRASGLDDTPGELALTDLLPAANLIYSLSETMNLRGGYSRTLARPNIMEISPFQRLPYIGGPDYVGNPALERTLIDNVDLRWEWFFSLTEMVSVSAFYKNFNNPIELAQDFTTQNTRFRYVNRDFAFLYGTEIEVKKNFGFIAPALEKLTLGANASFMYSETRLTDEEIRNIQAVDPDRPDTRPLFGQSPYVFNGELAYTDKEQLGITASLNLNVFGPRLFAVGGEAPDIYEQPRPAMNFSISKDIGQHFSVRFRANNLFNPDFKFTQEFRGEEFMFRNNKLGQTFSLGVTFNI